MNDENKFAPDDIVMTINSVVNLWVIVKEDDANPGLVFVKTFNSPYKEATRALWKSEIRHVTLVDLCSLRLALDQTIQNAVRNKSVIIKEHS